jgi:hypothetical protein
MNTKTIASAAGAALSTVSIAALPFAVFATTAQASTNGCELARFTCGTLIPYMANTSAIAAPGWAASADAAGAPLVMERDTATNPATDFRLTRVGGDGLRVEYAPGGKLSGLCVGVNVASAYRFRGVTVRPGSLVLAGCDRDWGEGFYTVPDHGGTEVVNDLTGLAVAPSGVGRQVRTVPVPVHRSSVAWRFQGN